MSAVREIAHTLAALCSLAAIAYGTYQVAPPAAWIVTGALVLAGVIYARTRHAAARQAAQRGTPSAPAPPSSWAPSDAPAPAYWYGPSE